MNESRSQNVAPFEFKWVVIGLLFAICVAPTFISYQPYTFQWDDSEYLTRSIAVSRAFWSGSLRGAIAWTVSERPPAMTLLGLPWGSLPTWHAAGSCFITLAAAISLLMASCLYLLLRIGVEARFILIASLCVVASIGPYPPGATAHAAATGFLSDGLFAWTALAALLLIPYEAARAGSSKPKSLREYFLEIFMDVSFRLPRRTWKSIHLPAAKNHRRRG